MPLLSTASKSSPQITVTCKAWRFGRLGMAVSGRFGLVYRIVSGSSFSALFAVGSSLVLPRGLSNVLLRAWSCEPARR